MAPEPLPLGAKVRPSDRPGVALLDRLDGRVYQHCPGLCPDPRSPDVAAWVAGVEASTDADVHALAEVPRREWAELWVAQYLWVHQDWSPAAEGPLREVARELMDEVDPDMTSVAVRDSRVSAVTWVFDGHDGTAEVVGETVQSEAHDGVDDVAACLARGLRMLAHTGVQKAEIDGHITDPHLQPVLDFPTVPREPLDLVEIWPVTATPRSSNCAARDR
jgi:hypothetical protein